MFKNRNEAGKLLAEKLADYKNDSQALILAIPRGGIVPAYEISKQLNIPLEIALVKKIGHPNNKEFAIGAVSLEEEILIDISDIPDQYIQEEKDAIRKKMRMQQDYFMENRKPIPINGKHVIIVDDGIATGITMSMVIELTKKAGAAKIIVAVPVAPSDTVDLLQKEVDELIVLETPDQFRSVGNHYENFEQVENEIVKDYLNKAS